MENLELMVVEPIIADIQNNSAELKKALSEKLEKYRNLTFSKENLKEAKETSATLNKLQKAIDDRRKAIKKAYLEKYNIFEDELKEIEAMMPENAMIAQLPYAAYPQYPAVNEMAEYSHFKGYLHSDKLRWSYGAMKGREGDLRYRLVANMPLGETIKSLSFEGFKGIYIDSFGYPDKGTKVITNISKILKIDPIVSDNHRLYFFDMRKSVRKFNTTFSKKLNPIVAPTSGFYGIESWSGVSTSWMQSDATLAVFSPDNCTAKLSLHALSFYRPRTIEIYVGDELAGHVPVPSTGFTNVTAHVRLADGTNTVHMHVPEGCERPCDIKVLKNSDSRCLSIAVQNVTVA